MEPTDFCYWLQGFFEMSGAKTLDESQVEMLKKHLNLVMTNVTGSCPPLDPKTETIKPIRSGVSSFPSNRKIC